jgi:hypothetical protein
MMTTMAALLGALPLAFGHGDGAELRAPLGIAIAGGLIMSQVLTLHTTPVVYLYMDRLRVWSEKRADGAAIRVGRRWLGSEVWVVGSGDRRKPSAKGVVIDGAMQVG